MFENQSRDELREVFFQSFKKKQAAEALSPLETMVSNIIAMHPEYHAILSMPQKYKQQEYFPEFGQTNPFLHMSSHISLQEQITTNRPKGIRKVYKDLLVKYKGEVHDLEHAMIECLMSELWHAQRENRMPDEKNYLKQLKKL